MKKIYCKKNPYAHGKIVQSFECNISRNWLAYSIVCFSPHFSYVFFVVLCAPHSFTVFSSLLYIQFAMCYFEWILLNEKIISSLTSHSAKKMCSVWRKKHISTRCFLYCVRCTKGHSIQSEFSALLQIKVCSPLLRSARHVSVWEWEWERQRATTIVMQNLPQLYFSYDHRILIFAFENNWRQHFQSNSVQFLYASMVFFFSSSSFVFLPPCYLNSDAILFPCNKSLVTFKSLPHIKHNSCYSTLFCILSHAFLLICLGMYVCVWVCECLNRCVWFCAHFPFEKLNFSCMLFCSTQIKSYLSFGSSLNMYIY